MKKQKLPIYLGDVMICGLPYGVYEATGETHAPLVGNYGVCHNDSCRIFLDVTMPAALWMQTLMHEILHGLYANSGIGNLNTGSDFEEQYVKVLTPHLVQAIKSIKNLKVRK